MPRYEPRSFEHVFCSIQQGSVYARELTAIGGVVCLTRVSPVTSHPDLAGPGLTLDEIINTMSALSHRRYHGPVTVQEGVASVCPFCGSTDSSTNARPAGR